MVALDFPRSCLLFCTHKWDAFVERNYEAYRASLQGICDVRFVFQNDDQSLPIPDGIHLTTSDIFDRHPCAKDASRKVTPGNADLLMLAAAEAAGPYARYLVVEYDVVCLLPIVMAISEILSVTRQADVVGSYITSQEQAPDWMWWNSLKAPEGKSLPDIRLKSFLPLSVYSQAFVSRYRSELMDGWQGHQEVLVPTIAALHGLKTFNLNGSPWGYTGYPQFTIGEPSKLDAAKLPVFLHAVKSMEDFDRLPPSIRQRVWG